MLHDGRIIGQTSLEGGLRLRRLTDADVLNVRPTEDDVLVDLISGSNGSVGRTVLGTERSNFRQCHRRHLGIDGVQDSLISDFRFGDEADL